jgi:hypothetical protein
LVDQRTAEITADGVVARVGSALGGQHSAVQVLLARGEAVALLEPPSPTAPFVRIAPPAGEFRWIAARRLSRMPPMETPTVAADARWQSHSQARVTRASAAAEPVDGGNSGEAFSHLRDNTVGPTKPNDVLTDDAAGQQTSSAGAEFNQMEGGAGDSVQIIAGSPAAAQQAQYLQPADADRNAGAATDVETPSEGAQPLSAPPRIRFEGLSATGPLDPRVAEMQLRLSEIVIGPPTAWQFAALREETASLLAQESSLELRNQLRDLLDRIATFETVQARYRTAPAGALTPEGAASAVQPADGPATTEDGALLARVRADLGMPSALDKGRVDNGVTPTPGGPAPAAAEALYDAVGTLKPVVSRRQGAPQFALLDDHGDVVTFLTASPDVNLQAYIGQRIGVRGSRGFMPEYRRAHVTASRVTSLERTLIK